MKYLSYFFFVCLLSIGGTVLAQDEVGYIKYGITDIESDNPQIQQQADMMKKGFTETMVNDEKVLVISNMAGMAVSKNLIDKETGNTTMYMDAMGKKIMVDIPKDKSDEMNNKSDVDVSVEKLKDESKEILGYKAYKTLLNVKSENGSSKIEMWTTDEISMDMEKYGQLMNLRGQDIELDGVPLEFTVDANGMMKMTYTAESVKMKDEVDQTKFDVDTTGYKKMTLEEFQQSMGGGMGGM